MSCSPSGLGKDSTDVESFGYFDDIDDYNNEVATITGATSSSGDYIDNNISMLTNVYYGDDQPKNINGVDSSFGKNMDFSNPFRKASEVRILNHHN